MWWIIPCIIVSIIFLLFLIAKIRSKIGDNQDRAIDRTNIKTKIAQIDEELSSQIQTSREDLNNFEDLALELFPGLTKRIRQDKYGMYTVRSRKTRTHKKT